VLERERAATIDITKGRACARAVDAAINREGVPRPTFAKASWNVATMATLLDTLPAPSADGVDKVYRQLKEILGVTVVHQAESSLQRWAGVSILSLGCSKAS
jgi:hypothetical protein